MDVPTPLADLQVGDSRFLGFVKSIQSESEAHSYQATLKNQHPNAAHVAYCWILVDTKGNKFGFDEDGEPSESTGPWLLSEIQEILSTRSTLEKGLVLGVVRYFRRLLLGVTCGRLSQCYSSTAKLALHRYWESPTTPLIQEHSNVSRNLYGLAAGDCEVILDVVDDLEKDEGGDLLTRVLDEVEFDGFKGSKGEELPRLQNLQAFCQDGIIPVYRYPGNYHGDEWITFPWSRTCFKLKEIVETALLPLVKQEMNHCVTNYYRSGEDFIQHHSDKILDLHPDAVIVSVSLGDERMLELKRRAEPQDVTRVVLPHGSMLVLGPRTNQQFTHAILQKKDSTQPRVSLTLRNVTTYMDLESGRLFGQGVSTKKLEQAKKAVKRERKTCLFLGFCFASAAVSTVFLSQKDRNRPVSTKRKVSLSLALALSTKTFSWSLRYCASKWYNHHEERLARGFFSKSSISGTKY